MMSTVNIIPKFLWGVSQIGTILLTKNVAPKSWNTEMGDPHTKMLGLY